MSRKDRHQKKRREQPGARASAGASAPASPGLLAQGQAPGARLLIPFDNWYTVVLLALATAGLMALAFPPLSWSWAAHLALAPMLLAIVRSPSRWSVALATGLAGLAFFGSEMYWLIMTTWPSYVGAVLYCLLFWIGFGLLLRWSVRRTMLPLVLLAPLWWVAMEMGRSYALTGFPWLLLGHAQARTLVLLQSADVAGVYGLSALAAATAGLLVDLITRPVFLRYQGHIRVARALKFGAAGLAAAWLMTIGYGIFRLRPVEMIEGPLVVAVQSNVPQDLLPTYAQDSSPDESAGGSLAQPPEAAEATATAGQGGEKDGLFRAYRQLHRATVAALAAHPEADLVVWPETMAPGYMNWEILYPRMQNVDRLPPVIRRSRNFWTEINKLIAAGETRLLIGSQAVVWPDAMADRPNFHNSAILMRPDDEPFISRTRYDKVHLVPFGEYVPFRESAPWLYDLLMKFTPYSEDYNLTPGRTFVRMEAGGKQFAAPICFESAIARVCRQMVYEDGRKAADFLTNISNDGWFHDTIELEQHWDQSVFRAVENRVPVVRSVNTGISGFIDSYGRTVSRVNDRGQVRSVTGYAAWHLTLDPRESFYGHFGDVFGLLLSVLALMTLAMPRRWSGAGSGA